MPIHESGTMIANRYEVVQGHRERSDLISGNDHIPDPNTGKDRWQIHKIFKVGMGLFKLSTKPNGIKFCRNEF